MNRNPSMAGLASLVQSRGRNGDSMLVHMTPGEVKGLHALALAHGGQLTINPDTGLYEANFLKKLLPTVLGFGLNFLFPGLGALGSAALVGAGETIRTGGDLGKGLMAGLGAFGGAGLGSAVSGIGAAATDASTKMLAQEAAQNLGKEAGAKAAQEAVTNQIKHQAANQAATLGGRLSNFGAGAKELFTGSQNLGLGGFGGVKALGSTMGMPAISGLGMTAANAMSPDMKIPSSSYEIDDSYYESGGYDPVTGTFREGRFRKGYPGFPPPGMAGGGVIPAPNGNYPLARPSNSVGGYEIDVDPYTGEERFAAGGAAFGKRKYEEMPADRQSLEPNSAKAGWMEYMRSNPEAQKAFLDAGYPAEFFQQDPNTFTGNRPFIPGKDESTRESEQERLMKAGYSPSYFEQFRPSSASAAPQQAQPMQQPQSLEDYYQSLLAPPAQQSGGNQGFSDYMQSLNKYVTSPIAPPPPPPKQQPPATGVAPPGAGGRPIAGGGINDDLFGNDFLRKKFPNIYNNIKTATNAGDTYGGDGAMRWDANQGRFVSDAPRTPFSAGNMPSGSPFSGFGGIDFSALQRMFSGGAEPSGGMPGGQNQYGGDVSNMPLVNEYDQFIGDMGQGAAGTPPQDQGQQPYDFSGMDFSGLQNMNLNMSGIGGSGSYMPDMSQQAQPDMGQQYLPYMGQQYARETFETYDNPFANQQYQQYQPDMSQQYQPEYAGGTPNYDMGNQPIQEFLGTPYMPEMAYGPPTDVTNQYPGVYGPTTTFSDLTAAETYDPTAGRQPVERPVFPSGDQMQYAPPSPDFSGVDSGLIPQAPPESMQPGLSGYVPPPDMGGLSFAAFKPPQPEVPPPSMSQMLGGFDGTGGGYGGSMGGLGSLGGMPQMQQAAPQPMPQPMPQFSPQPAFDMSNFGGGFDGGNMNMFAAGGPIQYAAAGKFLRGPGDGMSDDIKANINGEQEARLADGEFVIPADVVSHIGNGSSEAGADRLHVMMDRIRKARTGRTRQAPEIDADKYLPA